jgi:hypothetical protein
MITSKRVAVVVPGYNRPSFTDDEEISLRHLECYLSAYDRFLVVPHSLNIHRPGYFLKRFSDHYFGSPISNTRLMLSQEFYASFAEYQYILIYQTDALVFSDQLLQWCATDLDYIGAPWLKCEATPLVEKPRVGNGGFSLRKVESFLKVMASQAFWIDPRAYWASLCAGKPTYYKIANLPRTFLKYMRRFNGVRRELNQWHQQSDGYRQEDLFWADRAIHYYPEFKVASFEMGLKFAFEVEPRRCFELNNGQLPFGCHAWPKFDRSFWEPYLLK